MRKDVRQQFNWSGNLEQLEERMVMSADPLGGLLGGQIQHHAIEEDIPALEHHQVAEEPPAIEHHRQSQADFWIDSDNLQAIDNELERIEQSLANAHDQSGLTQVRTDYGFDGTGQTVAIIDSGIAYDHFALGGGFGSNYRVVGGWDFTGENDANPYDDGAAGSHGTHVAGIVGASGGTHEGVAPGVDLVGLRVFDDAGDGYFSWVENALQWVHDNQDSFENPITAVNLSLGVASWNADAIPQWANLENEFNLLKQDGIFISVSAGNSYTSFNTPGLSYPAASPHVVPVASVDDSGLLSYYSQRNSRVIAAPGRGIISTVPDYKGNNNGIVDDYASFSGTSMAAPYVAGASVIIREAMEFAGYTNITQDTIYNHMIDTADSFYDSATDANYNRLNLEAAIDALMPTDEFGSTIGSAYNLGSLGSDMSMNGAITTLDDVDYFKFTASSSGSVSFTVSNLTHDLAADWQLDGGSGVWSGQNNETFTIDVVAGQEYTVGFSSDDGLGYYDLDITSEAGFTFTDWGAISYSNQQGLTNTGDTWYRIVSNAAGFLTTEAMFDSAGAQVSLELYNSNMQLIDTGNAANGTSRVDAYTGVDTEFFLKVSGDHSDFDLRINNLVSLDQTWVTIQGTSGADSFEFTAGDTHQVVVNGTSYDFADNSITHVNFVGGSGTDSIVINGTAANESATLWGGAASVVGDGFQVSATQMEDVRIYSGGGTDNALFYDSSADDRFVAGADSSWLIGNNFFNYTEGFAQSFAYATAGGNDTAYYYDSAGSDRFVGRATDSWMVGSDFYNYARGFDQTFSYALNGGFDTAIHYDSADDDRFVTRSTDSWMTGNGFYNYSRGFDQTLAYANNGGDDTATYHDSASNDRLIFRPTNSWIVGTNYYSYLQNFESTMAYSSEGGTDVVYYYDSSGDDNFVGRSYDSWMTGSGFYNYANGFAQVQAYALNGGNDTATYYDSAGDDRFVARDSDSWMIGSGFYNYARGFDNVNAYAQNGGTDEAVFSDMGDGDSLFGADNYARRTSNESIAYVEDFDEVAAAALAGETPESTVGSVDYAFEQLGSWS